MPKINRRTLLAGSAATFAVTLAPSARGALPLVAWEFLSWLFWTVVSSAVQWEVSNYLNEHFGSKTQSQIADGNSDALAATALDMGVKIDDAERREVSVQLAALIEKQRAYFRSPSSRSSQLMTYIGDAETLLARCNALGPPGLQSAISAIGIKIGLIGEVIAHGDAETQEGESANIRVAIADASKHLGDWRANVDALLQLRIPADQAGQASAFQASFAPHFEIVTRGIAEWKRHIGPTGLWTPEGTRPSAAARISARDDYSVYFSPGGISLMQAQRDNIARAVEQYRALQARRRTNIVLRGCADRAEAANTLDNGVALARARANAVRDALIGNGVPIVAISIEALGVGTYLAGDISEYDIPQNRRVSIEFVDAF